MLCALLRDGGAPPGLGPISCIAMGCAAVFSLELAEAVSQFTTSVIYGCAHSTWSFPLYFCCVQYVAHPLLVQGKIAASGSAALLCSLLHCKCELDRCSVHPNAQQAQKRSCNIQEDTLQPAPCPADAQGGCGASVERCQRGGSFP